MDTFKGSQCYLTNNIVTSKTLRIWFRDKVTKKATQAISVVTNTNLSNSHTAEIYTLLLLLLLLLVSVLELEGNF